MNFRFTSSLLLTLFCLLVAGLIFMTLQNQAVPLPSAFGEEAEEAVGASEEPAAAPESEPHPWDMIETIGEEGEVVETVYDKDQGRWVIIGERGLGVGMYGALEFQVPMRKVEDIPMYPCSDCHKKMEINDTPRKLKRKHADLVVDHANDRFWCTACHNGKGLDFLASKDGRRIDMDHGYLQCGECHFEALKDWEYGVHGLRIGLWKGPRVLRTCTECHNAHTPQIQPETPVPPPTVRENLRQFSKPTVVHQKVWERLTTDE